MRYLVALRRKSVEDWRIDLFRLFTAIALPPEIRQRLTMLCLGLPGVLWVDPEQFHLTVRYIGPVDGGMFADIRSALALVEFEPFEITLEGVGFFPLRRRPEKIWVGVQKSEALGELRHRIDSALRRCGAPADPRKYTPHVTIGRFGPGPVKTDNPPRLAGYLSEFSLFRTGPIAVERFGLFSSARSHSGPQYLPEAWYPPESEGELDNEALP
ncbi:RNA 2',3'-cyclic phosphodiesterase [candidate division GN15 bacterium]|nr:RNA 2',3'-cyclic phosphodiesterase [candidate division GN15 bacterium]